MLYFSTDMRSVSTAADETHVIFVNATKTTKQPTSQKLLGKIMIGEVVATVNPPATYEILPYPIIRGKFDTEHAVLTDAFAFVDNQMQPALKEHSSGLLVNNAPVEYYPKLIIQNWDYI